MTKAADMIAKLDCLHVWPQSIADNHAEMLSPRQIENLYEVGKVATEAATLIAHQERRIEALREALDFIAPALPVLRDMLKRAHLPIGADKAAEMEQVVIKALGEIQ